MSQLGLLQFFRHVNCMHFPFVSISLLLDLMPDYMHVLTKDSSLLVCHASLCSSCVCEERRIFSL